MTILVTGFDPVGDKVVNPAWEVVRRLPDDILGHASQVATSDLVSTE